jgi:hypothetical protein
MRDLRERFADLDLLGVPEMRSDVDTRIADQGFTAVEVPVRPVPTPRWKGPLIAVGTAAVILVVVAGSLLLLGGGEADVVDEPIPTTLVPPATTVPVTEATSPVVGAWNPILSTTVAGEAPAAATCPPGTNPDVPGPVDQVRPANEGVGVVTAVFDRHAGRVVYVNQLRETWTFDVCTNTWYQMHPTGALIGGEFFWSGLVYDVDSDVTIALGSQGVYVYDANTNTWTHPANDRLGPDTDHITPYDPVWGDVPYGGVYDPVSGLIITSASRRNSETNSDSLEFWAYDVDTNEWTLLDPVRREPRAEEGFVSVSEFLGYSEQLDRLIVPGGIRRSSLSGSSGSMVWEEATILVDPRTGDVTVLPIESPGIDPWLPNGTYGAAGGTVYVATMTLDTPHDICGFDANVKSWTACFDAPDDADIGPLVGDSINNRLVLLNAGPWAGTILNGNGAIDFDTGEWTQIVAPSPISYPSTP